MSEPAIWRNRGEFRGGEQQTAVVSGVTFSEKTVRYSEVDGLAIFEGDIVLGTVEQLQGGAAGDVAFGVGITGQRFRWPGGVVPFDIDPAAEPATGEGRDRALGVADADPLPGTNCRQRR